VTDEKEIEPPDSLLREVAVRLPFGLMLALPASMLGYASIAFVVTFMQQNGFVLTWYVHLAADVLGVSMGALYGIAALGYWILNSHEGDGVTLEQKLDQLADEE